MESIVPLLVSAVAQGKNAFNSLLGPLGALFFGWRGPHRLRVRLNELELDRGNRAAAAVILHPFPTLT
jgi:hypothetical protein